MKRFLAVLILLATIPLAAQAQLVEDGKVALLVIDLLWTALYPPSSEPGEEPSPIGVVTDFDRTEANCAMACRGWVRTCRWESVVTTNFVGNFGSALADLYRVQCNLLVQPGGNNIPIRGPFSASHEIRAPLSNW